MALNIQRNDTVQVISGSSRGKQGRVLRVMPDADRILVEHVHIIKKNVKPNPQKNIKGGIAEQEAPIHISNVLLVCGSCGPDTRGSQARRRHQGARLQEVRQHIAQSKKEVSSSVDSRSVTVDGANPHFLTPTRDRTHEKRENTWQTKRKHPGFVRSTTTRSSRLFRKSLI